MIDVADILIANLGGAFDQLNNYVVVGLTAALSALVLDVRRQSAGDAQDAATPLGPMGREPAKLVFLAICFVAGTMAYYAAEQATTIASLVANDAVIDAACTRASVATGPLGVRFLAAFLPAALAVRVVIRASRREADDRDARAGLYGMAALLVIPYLLLGRSLLSLCR
jgi:hypothetical protein